MAKETSEEASFSKNYAEDRELCDRFFDEVKSPISDARSNRRTKEEIWLEDLRLWACNLTDAQMYAGRSNLFIPELHHQVENSVSKQLSGIFPGEEYFGVIPLKQTSEETAENIRAAVFDQFENRNHIRTLFDRHERQKILFGTSPLRPRYVRDGTWIYTRDQKGRAIKSWIPKFRGVKWEVIDLFRWYIVPEWAEMYDCYMTFEDAFVPSKTLKEAKDENGKPLYANLDDVKALSSYYDEHNWVDVERLASNAITVAAQFYPGCVLTTTVFKDFEIKKGQGAVPCTATIANNNQIIQLKRNPYWFQMPPYAVGRYLRFPTKNFYGLSFSDKTRSLQYQINDIGNQTMDSLNYSLNPICAIDPALAGDPNSFKLKPGAKWWASPQGVQFFTFPDVSSSGFQAMQQVRAMVSQFSDNATGIAPQLQGKARSATQASVVDREVSKDLKITVENEEVEVMIPMCIMTHSMLQQYETDAWIVKVLGPDKTSWTLKQVNPTDIVGEVNFVWRGSSIAERTALKNQQLMNFFQLCLQANATVPEMRGKFDFPKFIEVLAKDNFEIENLDKFMVDVRNAMSVDQDLENIALTQGEEAPVHHGDDDDEHLQKIDAFINEQGSKLKLDQKVALYLHAQKHEAQKQAKAKLEEQEAQIKAYQMSQQQQGQGQGLPGNKTQIAQGTNEANLTRGMRAVEPNM